MLITKAMQHFHMSNNRGFEIDTNEKGLVEINSIV